MTQAEVKTLCEADDKLQWWAMVLFAEIAGFVPQAEEFGGDANKLIADYVRNKTKEFPRLVIRRALENATPEPTEEAK